jgi:hypothetical protein
MAIPAQGERWHRDILVFAVLCTLWSALLIFRVVTRDPFSSQAYPFQNVFLGVKFYGRLGYEVASLTRHPAPKIRVLEEPA